MKVMFLSLCVIFCYMNSIAQQASFAKDAILASSFTTVNSTDIDDLDFTHHEYIAESERKKEVKVENLQDSKLARDFIIHPSLHANKYLLISYTGSSQTFCLLTDETDQVVYRHPLKLTSSTTWINLQSLPAGDYQLNLTLDGVTYRQSFRKDSE